MVHAEKTTKGIRPLSNHGATLTRGTDSSVIVVVVFFFFFTRSLFLSAHVRPFKPRLWPENATNTKKVKKTKKAGKTRRECSPMGKSALDWLKSSKGQWALVSQGEKRRKEKRKKKTKKLELLHFSPLLGHCTIVPYLSVLYMYCTWLVPELGFSFLLFSFVFSFESMITFRSSGSLARSPFLFFFFFLLLLLLFVVVDCLPHCGVALAKRCRCILHSKSQVISRTKGKERDVWLSVSRHPLTITSANIRLFLPRQSKPLKRKRVKDMHDRPFTFPSLFLCVSLSPLPVCMSVSLGRTILKVEKRKAQPACRLNAALLLLYL